MHENILDGRASDCYNKIDITIRKGWAHHGIFTER